MRGRVTAVALVLAALAGCHTGGKPETMVPPRVTQAPRLPQGVSTLVVPVTLPLAVIERDLNARLPRKLWSIDRHQDKCVTGQRVKALGLNVKITPDLSCRIVGEVDHGRLRLSGAGQRIDIVLPVTAAISARNVAGVLHETANGAATVRATALLGLTRDWVPTAKVAIAYDWTTPPGIDFLGQRIVIVDKADAKLAGVIARLERELRDQIGRVAIRPVLEDAWRHAFTVIELNHEKPPAWMRITPVRAGMLGYAIADDTLVLTAAAEVRGESFIGGKPPPLPPTPLPPQLGAIPDRGLDVSIPLLADYTQLEPVVLRALRKLDARGIVLPRVGRVRARFDKVTIYATVADRIAVGIDAAVEPVDRGVLNRWGKAKGEVWLTGKPANEPDSEVVTISDLRIFGRTDRAAADLLLQVAASDAFRGEIAGSLTQDFGKDYTRVLGKARHAIADKRVGDFVLSATVDQVHHGLVKVTGAGLFMPVAVTGRAKVAFSPQVR